MTSTPFGLKRVGSYEAPLMAIGKVRLHKPECVYCTDQTLDAQIFGERIDGSLGMDVLRHLILSVDFDKASLSVLNSASSADGTPVAIHRRSDLPFIEMDIGSVRRQLAMVATGRNGPDAGMLDHRIFKQLQTANELDIVGESYTSSLSRTRRMVDGRVTTVTVANRTTKGLIFAQGPGSVLGLGYLSRYVVTFDFPNNVMYLRPGRQAGRIDVPDRSGLHILRIDDEVVVHSIDRGSLGEACGLKTDDRVLAIDGVAASELTMYEVRRRFHIDAGQRRLLVRRGNTELPVVFDAKPVQHNAPRRPKGR